MYILGINCYYHDASAALVKDGVLVAAAEEERFTRKKHDNSFPINAINYCLKSLKMAIDDISYVAFSEKPLVKFERVISQHLESFPYSLKTFLGSVPPWMTEKLRLVKTTRKKLGYSGEVLFVEHHMAHAASSFLVSPFEKAAILTIDGVGEWTTTALGVGSGSYIELLKEIRFPHSIGLFYSAITAYLGFEVNEAEYKVMGLSAYGNKDKQTNAYYRKLRALIDLKDDGSFNLDMSYFKYHYSDIMVSDKLCELLDGPVRTGEITARHKDIAAALQMITEEVIIRMLNHLHLLTKCKNVVLAGGVSLNSVANGKILRSTGFKRIWVQPAPGDGGTSIGAAFYVYNSLLGNPRSYVLKDAYLGPGYTPDSIRSYLDVNKIEYIEFVDYQELIKTVAKLIYDDNVIGWFQGRMEWGPRALGNRSILSNPCNPEMKDILNLKVKHREMFRPFAPVVCSDDALKYFDCDKPIPEPAKFMLMVYPIFRKWRHKIPAVTHVDGSGRLQVVSRQQNPLYYDLIKQFGRLSKIPILINTSFNVKGEPIVCSPKDAYLCFKNTGIDYLVIDRFMVRK